MPTARTAIALLTGALSFVACRADAPPEGVLYSDPDEIYLRVDDLENPPPAETVQLFNFGPDELTIEAVELEGDNWEQMFVDPGAGLPTDHDRFDLG